MADSLRTPFDDIRDLVAGMPSIPPPAADDLADDPGLGRLGDLAGWVARAQGKTKPGVDRALVCLFVATHGVALGRDPAQGIAATRAELDGFAAGAAPINAACASGALGFKAFDLALDLPTGDIASEPAMDERGCVATMAFGMEAVAGGTDILALGCAGIGGDLAAAAMLAALYGDAPARWAAPDLASAAALRIAAALGRSRSADTLTALADLGGRDLAAVAGAILAARHQRAPVVLDGFAATAAAAILHALDPTALDHCAVGALSPHPAHAGLAARLGLEPILPGMAIRAPGVGAALALGVVKGAVACASGVPVGTPG